jgi:hypothetical protein
MSLSFEKKAKLIFYIKKYYNDCFLQKKIGDWKTKKEKEEIDYVCAHIPIFMSLRQRTT